MEEGEDAAGAAAAVGATGIWQNFPVKLGGQRQRSFCRQTPPFLQSRGQRTVGEKQEQRYSVPQSMVKKQKVLRLFK